MAVILSPWPEADPELTAARAYLRAQCAGRTDDDNALDSLGQAASALVERYAPGAPAANKAESVVRMVGYMGQSDFGGVASETTVGSQAVTWTVNHAGMFRNCGAAALLSPWRIRRAGAI